MPVLFRPSRGCTLLRPGSFQIQPLTANKAGLGNPGRNQAREKPRRGNLPLPSPAESHGPAAETRGAGQSGQSRSGWGVQEPGRALPGASSKAWLVSARKKSDGRRRDAQEASEECFLLASRLLAAHPARWDTAVGLGSRGRLLQGQPWGEALGSAISLGCETWPRNPPRLPGQMERPSVAAAYALSHAPTQHTLPDLCLENLALYG